MMQTASADIRANSPARAGRGGALPRTVRVDPRLTAGLGLVFALAAGMLLAWLGGIYHRIEADNNQALMRADNERLLRLSALAITESMAEVMSDLRFLSHSTAVGAYLRKGKGMGAANLTSEYAALIAQKRNFDQIRFIGPDGWERIRVNRAPDGARITPTDQLLDKHSRYYFEALTWLNADEIYVSPMDLNVEHGQIEQPPKPTIRFGVAIYDQQGTRRGYIVINYLAEQLLLKLRNLSDNKRPLWLLDAQGRWLLGPDADDARAGLSPALGARSFAGEHPTAWKAMLQQATGFLPAGNAKIQFLRVYPLYSLTDVGDQVLLAQPTGAESYFWYSLIASPATDAAQPRLSDMTIMGSAIVALLVLAASFTLAYAIARQRALSVALEQAMDNLPAMVAYIDAGQRFRFNNRAYLDAYGLTPKDLYGRHLHEILGEDGYAMVRPHLEQALAGQRQAFDLHVAGGSSPRDLAITYVPDMDANGKARGVYALVDDITERKALEQRDKARLVEFAQMSRLANVGEITTEIAHQVNQPLAAIAMFSNAAQRTLENGGDQGKLRDWMETINAQAKRASEVIQRLRRFAHRGEIKTSPVDLNASAREVFALVEPEARARQVALRLELADALPAVMAAGILMEQVIYNLAHNAIRAAAEQAQPGQVTIRTHADARRIWLSVIDNGPWRGGARDQDAGDGQPIEQTDEWHGVGLSISRGIVTNYQGDMIYRQHDAGGTEVCFFLPRLEP